MVMYFSGMAATFGMNVWLFSIILLWSLVWKLFAFWKSARRGDKIWFIVLAVVNTVGILEILYIFVFSKMKKKSVKRKVKRKR